jgi:hypothetical protein
MRRRLTILLASILLLGLAACGGDDPAPVSTPLVPTIDTAPPAPPTGVSCANLASTVKVSWEAGDHDVDFVGIRLTRTAANGTVVLVDQPVDIDRWVDDHPFAGVATYAVTAVDEEGNESAAATVVHEYQPAPGPRPSISF